MFRHVWVHKKDTSSVLCMFPIRQRTAASLAAEKIGERALVAEAEVFGDLTDGLIGGPQLDADFIVEKVRKITEDGITRQLLDRARQIGGRNIHAICIELQLPLLTEMSRGQMEKNTKDIIFVFQIMGVYFMA